MKTKTKTLFIIGLAGALCIGFLIGISVDYPKTSLSNLAGTYGKAEKYRNVKMTEKDIQMRSELMKDTARLKSMIQELTYFSVFTEKVSAQINLSILTFKSKGMGKEPGEAEKLLALQDYSDFIRNNNQSLNTTIGMLAGFYMNDTETTTVDVEKNLRDFGSYLTKLNEKNSILNEAFSGMDAFMINNKILHAHQAELAQLKSIRDQLTISGIELCTLLNNPAQIGTLLEYSIMAQEKLGGAFMSNGNLAVTATSNSLKIFSRDDLKSIRSSLDLGIIILGQEPANAKSALLYDRTNLQFVKSEGSLDLIKQIPGLDILVLFGSEKLNVLLVDFTALDVMQSRLMSSGALQFNAINVFYSSGNLGTLLNSSNGLQSALGVLKLYNLYAL